MAIYTVTHKTLIDNYASLQLLEPHDISPGDAVTVAGVNATFNGSRTVYATPEYLFIGVGTEGDLIYDYDQPVPYQIIYALTAADVERSASTGTVTNDLVACTWVTASDIEDWLGIGTATAGDAAFLIVCAAAANEFCFTRRKIAGYQDVLATAPNGAAKLGTTQYGGALYRQRGGLQDFATFDGYGVGSTTGLNGTIKQLLGIDRPTLA
jgi:hypothetical protein